MNDQRLEALKRYYADPSICDFCGEIIEVGEDDLPSEIKSRDCCSKSCSAKKQHEDKEDRSECPECGGTKSRKADRCWDCSQADNGADQSDTRSYDNPKQTGEVGESIAIGELAKIGVEVSVPLSDNLPYDLILDLDGQIYKAQVKTSTNRSSGSIEFSLTSNNWNTGDRHSYSKKDVDVFLLTDTKSVFVIGSEAFENRNSFTIRFEPPGNNTNACNFAEDYQLSRERLEQVT